MDEHREQHGNVAEFWKKNKEECCKIIKIDEVYDKYIIFHTENKEQKGYKYNPMNRYIFRTYIRKNGYCNSRTPEQQEKFEKEQQEKKLLAKQNKLLEKQNKCQGI
jgi:hypothetical protein